MKETETLDCFAMESDDSERQKKLEAGKEKVRIQLCDVAERAKFINYPYQFAFQLLSKPSLLFFICS